jgi:hypothetical protein
MTSAEKRRPLIYEPRRVRINSASIATMTCGLVAFLLFGGLESPWRYLAASLAVAAAPWAVWRAFRTGLVVTEEDVTVNNYWRTHKFAWSEVRGVGIGLKRQGAILQPSLAFSLRGGVAVFAQATPPRQTPRREFLAAVLALAPSSVEALPDRAGSIGSDRALSNRIRIWWSERR